MDEKTEDILKKLPQTGAFFDTARICEIRKIFGDGQTKVLLKDIIAEIRQKVISGKIFEIPSENSIVVELEKRLQKFFSPDSRRAINATGILLHTGLGRAPFSMESVAETKVFSGYSVLQVDINSGKRSLREAKIEKMLIELTGCEAATVVNNNAAATMLILNTLSNRKECIISRGQLIEIGGEFRMPDVMKKSGAKMKEVGTTNRTHLKDYAAALTEKTGAIIHVHTSNYRVRGFHSTPSVREIRKILDAHPSVKLIDDLGSGALVRLLQFGLPDEPLIKDSLEAGSDVVCFSGDKLICGPQSGIICGKKEIITAIRKNSFARMFRVCKMTLAVLEKTLEHFLNGTYKDKIPFYQMMAMDLETLRLRAEKLADKIKKISGIKICVEKDFSYVGSGSIPDEGIPSYIVKISGDEKTKTRFNAEHIASGLRMEVPAIFCRINKNSICLDMRSLFPADYEYLFENLSGIIENLKFEA